MKTSLQPKTYYGGSAQTVFILKYGSMNHEKQVYFDTIQIADAVIKAVQEQWRNAEIQTRC